MQTTSTTSPYRATSSLADFWTGLFAALAIVCIAISFTRFPSQRDYKILLYCCFFGAFAICLVFCYLALRMRNDRIVIDQKGIQLLGYKTHQAAWDDILSCTLRHENAKTSHLVFAFQCKDGTSFNLYLYRYWCRRSRIQEAIESHWQQATGEVQAVEISSFMMLRHRFNQIFNAFLIALWLFVILVLTFRHVGY
jgi:hypothetical protein